MMLRIRRLKAWVLALSAAFVTAVLWLPSAQASTFDLTIDAQTISANQVGSYEISLIGLTTDASNIATSLLSGSITGFGSDASWTGTLTLITQSSIGGTPIPGVFDFDGRVYSSAPYFSTGIVLEDFLTGGGIIFLNPYYNGDGVYYVAEAIAAGLQTNPGDLVTSITATTPLPDTLSMLLGGLALIGFLVSRKRTTASDVFAKPAAG